MKYSILGTNGFLSTAIAKFCNQKGYGLDMYGLHEPIGHSYDNFYKMNLVEENIDMSTLKNSDVIIYAIGAGIQSNLNESVNLIYSLNVNVPINICNQLRFLGYNGRFVTFGSVFEIGETSLKHPFTEEELLVSTSQAPNDYTVSKRILSRFVESYKHDYTHWHFFIPTIYGEGRKSNAINSIYCKCYKRRKGISIYFRRTSTSIYSCFRSSSYHRQVCVGKCAIRVL